MVAIHPNCIECGHRFTHGTYASSDALRSPDTSEGKQHE